VHSRHLPTEIVLPTYVAAQLGGFRRIDPKADAIAMSLNGVPVDDRYTACQITPARGNGE